ncbi:hypothetical protein [Streptomyces sp. NPDC008137]|uniref:hypothetical protein n=1 Tax=Streptomyces sp. NPDC008137 TaxID=3364813 RepID=UPI0036E3344A
MAPDESAESPSESEGTARTSAGPPAGLAHASGTGDGGSAPENVSPPGTRTGTEQTSPPHEASAPAADADAPSEDSGTGPYRVTVLDLGRFAVGAVTVAAALVGLILGIRAELYAGREDQRAAAEERRSKEDREKAYANLVDFYRMGSEVIVVNGSSRVMAMRLTLPANKVRWDLDLLQPCKQIAVPNKALLDSMAVEQPPVSLTEWDLAQLRLEFMDPMGKAWIRNSGGVLARRDAWAASGRPTMVSSEAWNISAQDAPPCDGS